MMLWPQGTQNYCFLKVVWEENSTLKRGNNTPGPVGTFWKLKSYVSSIRSVLFLIDQDKLGCYSNQNFSDLKQQKYISCSKSPSPVPNALQGSCPPYVAQAFLAATV